MAKAVCILVLPSRREAGWRSALAEAAASKGWRWLDVIDATEVALAEGENTLMVASVCDPSAGGAWTVLQGSVADCSAAKSGPEEVEAYWAPATRLAIASELAERGAVILDAYAEQVDIPGFGLIQFSQTAETVCPKETTSGHPLHIYQQVPPAIGAEAEWGPALYRRPIGDPAAGQPSVIDLTGRGRIIIHGPYIDLPPGAWRIEAEFLMDPEGQHTRLRFDWGVHPDFKTVSAVLTVPGRYAIELDKEWRERGPAQFRVWVDHGAFQGKLELARTRVLRIARVEPDDPTSEVG